MWCAYMLIRCNRWANIREQYLGSLLREIEEKDAGFTGLQTVTLLLGGEVVRNRLKSWTFAHDVNDPTDAESATDEESTEGAYEGPIERECVSLRLARFLTMMTQERSSVVRTLRPASGLAERPPSARDQSPNG